MRLFCSSVRVSIISIVSESSNIRRKMLVVLFICWVSVASVWVSSVRRR